MGYNEEDRRAELMDKKGDIEVQNLSKRFVRNVKDETRKIKFGHTKTKKEEFFAVQDVSFTATKGKIYGILGPNGAGKTTLLRMLGGILTPTSGKIEVMGLDYELHKEEAKRKIGYLSGNTKLYGRLSPRELFRIFGELYEMSPNEVEAAIESVSKIMDLDAFIDNRIENLSTGQTQRVSIGRCLIHKPDVYILDEPTLGLDVLSSKDIIEFMKREKEQGKIVLYSTHYMEEAESLCDEILMLHEGQIIAQGKPKQLMDENHINNLRDLFIHFAESGEAVQYEG